MSRFFVTPEAVGENKIIMDDPGDIHHMTKVLRLKEGDEIDISDQSQWEYRCQINSIEEGVCILQIIDKQRFSSEPETRVTLFQGIPKGSKFETIVQKTVELGVDTIQPVFMARTIIVDKGNYGKKVLRLNKIAAEAVKQCKRGMIPQVLEPIKTKEMLNMLGDYDAVIFPYENEEGKTIKDALRREDRSQWRNIALIIGPEGGFSEEEAREIVEAGGISVSLGKTILRTETAGMAAIAMVMYEMEL